MGCGSCSYKQGAARRKRKERKEGEGKKGKKERKRKEREKEKKGREKRKVVFRRSELVRPRSKVLIFDEGCTTRGRFPPTPIHFTPKGRVGA